MTPRRPALTDVQLQRMSGSRMSIPYVRMRDMVLTPEITTLVPLELMVRHRLVPIARVGQRLTIAMADPLDVLAADEIQLTTGFQVKRVIAHESEIDAMIAALAGPPPATLEPEGPRVASSDEARAAAGEPARETAKLPSE